MKLLIVGSRKGLRESVARALGELPDLTVEQSSDGADALERVRKTRFDLVVSDWSESSTGVELVTAIRGSKDRERVPVLLLADEVTRARIAEALEAGANGVVHKPFEAEALRQKVLRLTARTA